MASSPSHGAIGTSQRGRDHTGAVQSPAHRSRARALDALAGARQYGRGPGLRPSTVGHGLLGMRYRVEAEGLGRAIARDAAGTALLTTTILTFIWTFNDFAIVYILTKGGPGGSTMVLPVFTYEMAFGAQRLGEAIAAALYMLPPLAFVIVVLARYMRRGRAK